MAELLKAYPKDVSLLIEIPLKEMEALLDYMDRAIVAFNKDVEPDFQKTVDIAVALIKDFDTMSSSVRNFHNA